MNKAAVNLYIQVFVGTQLSLLLSKYLGAVLLDCLVSVCLQHSKVLEPVAPVLPPALDIVHKLTPNAV